MVSDCVRVFSAIKRAAVTEGARADSFLIPDGSWPEIEATVMATADQASVSVALVVMYRDDGIRRKDVGDWWALIDPQLDDVVPADWGYKSMEVWAIVDPG